MRSFPHGRGQKIIRAEILRTMWRTFAVLQKERPPVWEAALFGLSAEEKKYRGAKCKEAGQNGIAENAKRG